MVNFAAPDLTKHPPRSPRVRLGGYVQLPRLLDKARAFLSGTNGEYNYNCTNDWEFFEFTGIDDKAFLKELKKGRSDTEMLTWIDARVTRSNWEIAAWSDWMTNRRGPGSAEAHEYFQKWIKKVGPGRRDMHASFDRLDLDDYVSFGGKA